MHLVTAHNIASEACTPPHDELLSSEGRSDRKLLLYSFLFTFLLGLVAHGYAFSNLQLTHDSLGEFILSSNALWKVQLGRFLNPVIRFGFGEYVILPWFSGILGLSMIALSVFLTAKAFGLSSLWQLFAVSGIYALNNTVISCIASYMEDFTSDMTALLFGCAAMYCWTLLWKSRKRFPFIVGILSVVLTLGLYQAYLAVTLVLMMIWCIMRLLDGTKTKDVILHGLKGILMVVLGGVLYYLLTKVACALTGVGLSEDNYNSLNNLWAFTKYGFFTAAESYAIRLFECYQHFFYHLFSLDYVSLRFVILNAVLTLAFLYVFVKRLCSLRPSSIVVAVALVILLPPVMFMTKILSYISHDLTIFAMWLFYLLIILVLQKDSSCILRRIACCALVLVMLFSAGNANLAYIQKSIACDSTKSLMTNVVTRIERLEGYETKETPVAFIGLPNHCLSVPGPQLHITACDYPFVIRYYSLYQKYFDIILQYPIVLSSEEEVSELTKLDEVKAMPSYPDAGSITIIDGTVVVKFP